MFENKLPVVLVVVLTSVCVGRWVISLVGATVGDITGECVGDVKGGFVSFVVMIGIWVGLCVVGIWVVIWVGLWVLGLGVAIANGAGVTGFCVGALVGDPLWMIKFGHPIYLYAFCVFFVRFPW